MHSFFKPAGNKKRPNDSANDNKEENRPPQRFASWNVNSLGQRLTTKENKREFLKWMETEKPDVLCLQEIKHAAKDGQHRGVMRESAKSDSENKYSAAYRALISDLSDYRFALTLTAPNQGFSAGQAGQALIVRRGIETPKRYFHLEALFDDNHKDEHEPQGRVIIAHFEKSNIILLSTYSPNNGGSNESFARRYQWDMKILDFVKKIKEMSHKKFIWVGDLNVCVDDNDVSGNDIDFWYRYPMGGAKRTESDQSGNKGQAGFTRNEKERFAAIIAAGDLYDPFPVFGCRPNKSEMDTEGPWFSWRGHAEPAAGSSLPPRYRGMCCDDNI